MRQEAGFEGLGLNDPPHEESERIVEGGHWLGQASNQAALDEEDGGGALGKLGKEN